MRDNDKHFGPNAMAHGRFNGLSGRTIPTRDVPNGHSGVQNAKRVPVPGPAAKHTAWSPFAQPSLLIVDDHTLHRQSLTAVLASSGAATSSAWNLHSLLTALTINPPDLVLVNVDTRDRSRLLHTAIEICPQVKIIVLGMPEDDEARIIACAEAGVAGYHLRTESLDDLMSLIHKVAKGEWSCAPAISATLLRRLSTLAAENRSSIQRPVLTRREAQILRLLEMGLSNREISADLRIAVHTVKNHVHSVLKKLGVSTRIEAAAQVRTASVRQQGPEI